MTYMMVMVFLCMIGYIIYFMVKKADKVVANPANSRQDSFSKFVSRGNIETSDGVVVATTEINEAGEEIRKYPYDGLFAHTVGYNSYGRAGIELSENFDLLRSHVGVFSKISNDLHNRKNPGDKVITTLDYGLQSTAAQALGDARGAVVVLDADTGDVLTMYSSPTFNPNDMDNVWNSVHSEEGSESTVLLNRATQGMYAPGSTFKVITALEYMREHKDYENYTHICEGEGVFDGIEIRCSSGNVHGEVTLQDSIAQSCNTSFANIGENEIDIDKLHNLAEDLLYNKELPLSISYYESQFVLDGKSDLTEIPQTVIGQGETLTTPIHNAMIMQAICNGGVMMKPNLVKRIESVEGEVQKKVKPKSCGTVIDGELANQIIPMLREVCLTGTASGYLADKPYTCAGKTGTAEYDNNGNCNSWFVGFTNVDDPDIVVSVIVEDYTSNQITGVSVASQIMDKYYEGH